MATDYIRPREAAVMIGCHVETVYRYAGRGLLSTFHPLGRGRGKPALLKRSQVEAYVRRIRNEAK